MLVLTRKPGEQIVIAGNIRVSVVSIGQGRVKIGIEAPSDVAIDRQEIFEKRQTDQPTVVAPALQADEPATTGSGIHNRILDKLPPETAQTPAPAAIARDSRVKSVEHRFPPRKPR